MSVVAIARERAWLSAARLESAGALVASTAVALLVSLHLLRRSVFEGDAMVHQYWMRRFSDPELFTDALTAKLRASERYPDGYQGLFWLASHVADPVAFGEWLGVALMAIAGWLVFLIVREHTSWRPAAWIGGALFLALDGHRFAGGFPRGFLHLFVLGTVLLAMRRRETAAAVVAGGGALVYPPAALLSVGVLGLTSLRRRGVDPRRLRSAALAGALAAGAVLVPQLISGASFDVMTASEARRYPEFGSHGGLHYFVGTWLESFKQNRSGLDLRATSSVLLVAALVLLVARRGNFRRLRAEVLALPVVALTGWAVATVVLFKLYLPHRYTYPLVAFCAIAVGVLLRPTWEAASGRTRAFVLLFAPVPVALLALHWFPLGPERVVVTPTELVLAAAVLVACGALARWRAPRPAVGALLTGLILVGAVVASPARRASGQTCARTPAVEFIASLPKTAVIAGDPIDLKCLPVTASRPVVISTQLSPSYERGYFREGRERMFTTLNAYYGTSTRALRDLGPRYGATYLWVNRPAIRRERTPGARWRASRLPYGRLVQGLLAAGEPAVLHLPARCRVFDGDQHSIYDLSCL